ASATPLAAVLIAKGLSPGAALVGLLLGPATNLATLGFMRASFGARATWGASIAAVGVTWLLALGVNASGMRPVVAQDALEAHAHGALSYLALAVLVAWMLRTVYQSGVGALFEGLYASHLASEAHGHAHGHGHSH